MKKKDALENSSLRQRAEEQLKIKHSLKATIPGDADMMKLLHELEVHQIELEMQNEELRMANDKAASATALYNFAPTGYFTLLQDGTILELNFRGAKMLGKERSGLILKNISQYIALESLSIFKDFLTSVFESHSMQTCEVWMTNKDNTSTFIRLEAFISDGEQKCYVTAMDITEWKRAEKDKQISIERFKIIFEQSPLGIALVDSLTGRIIEVNEKFASIVGCSREETAKIDWMSITHPDDMQEDLNNMAHLIAGEFSSFQMNKRYLQPDGSVVWVNMTVTPILVDDKSNPCHLCMIEDITERKRTEWELLKEKNQLKLMIDSSPVSIWFKDKLNNFIKVNQAAAKIANRPVEEVEGHSADEVFPNESAKYYSDDLEVINSGKPKLGIVEPAVANGITTWVRTDKIPWFDNDGNIAGLISFALDITDRVDAEEKLRDSETRYRRLFESAKDGILIIDAESGRIVDANPYLVQMLEYSEAELLGKELWKIMVFRKIAKSKDAFIELQSKEYIRFNDMSLETKSGKLINVVIASNGYYVNQKKVIQCNIRDISKRKLVEEALLESEIRLQSLVRSIPDLIWLKDKSGVYMLCNTMFERFFGAKEVDIVGKTDYDFVTRKLADSFRKNDIKAMVAGNSTKNEEWVTFADDGHQALLETTKTPMYDSWGELIGVLGMSHDITRHKQAEESLKESQQLFQDLAQISPVGIFRTRADGYTTYVNPQWSELSGLSFDEAIGYGWLNAVHPDDRERLRSSWEKDIEIQHASNAEYRFLKSDGSIVWVIGNAVAEMKDDSIIGFIGTITDITERKATEEALVESEDHIRLVLENSIDAILSTTPDGKILSANTSACSMFGQTEEELIKKGWNGIIDLADPSLQDALEVLNRTGKFKGELTFLRNDGTGFPAEISSSLFRDRNGNLQSSMVIRDISDRRKSEDIIRQERILLRTLIDSLPDTIYIKDNKGRKLIANSSDLQIMNSNTEGEVIGKTDLEIFGPDIGATGYAEDRSVLETGQPLINHEDYFLDATGKQHWRLTSKIPIYDGQRQIVGLVGLGHDITDRKKSEELLKESEERFRSIFENATIGIYRTTQDGKILMANPALINMLGYKSFEEMVAGDLDRVISETENQRAEFRQRIEREGEIRGVEFEWKHKDNTIVHVRENAKVFRDNEGRIRYYEGMVENITERKEAEKEVKLLAHSLESISECVSITDNNDTLIYVNESFLKTYGYAKNELIGKSVGILRTADISHEHVRDILPETIEGGWRGEIVNKRKDGTTFPILLSTSVIKDENEKPIALIGVAIDITEMKKNREELIAAKENAEEGNRLKTAFLAMMNHELRTPLNHILGFSELILSGVAPEESHSFAASIQASGQNLLAIIEDVFDLALIEQDNIKLRNQTYSFMDHFMETKASFDNILRTSAKNEQIQLIFKPAVHFLSSYVTADRSKINQVLTNLFKNAVKFTQKGKIEFGFDVRNESTLTFYIKDTGIGIPIEKQSIIFDYFRQGDDSYTRSYGGIGIGLAISRKIAKILNGELSVVSEPGVGSTFSLTIPVELSER